MICEKCGARNAPTIVLAQVAHTEKTRKRHGRTRTIRNCTLKGTRNVSLCNSCVNFYAKNCIERNRESLTQLSIILGGTAVVGIILTIVPLTIRWIGAALFGIVTLITLPGFLRHRHRVKADRQLDEAQAIDFYRADAAIAHLNPRPGEQFIPYERLGGKTAEQIKQEWGVTLPVAKILEAQAEKFGYRAE